MVKCAAILFDSLSLSLFSGGDRWSLVTGEGLHTRLAASTLICTRTHITQQLHDKSNLLRLTRVTMETVARGEKGKKRGYRVGTDHFTPVNTVALTYCHTPDAEHTSPPTPPQHSTALNRAPHHHGGCVVISRRHLSLSLFLTLCSENQPPFQFQPTCSNKSWNSFQLLK